MDILQYYPYDYFCTPPPYRLAAPLQQQEHLQHQHSAASIQKIKYIFGEKPDELGDDLDATATPAKEEEVSAEAGEGVKEGWLNCKVTAVDGKVRAWYTMH